MDAITIQILRNKIASLVEEMHYHFYRSGYSTIIRESRDFSCVILDRGGRLIVRAADVLPRAGLPPPGRPHSRGARARPAKSGRRRVTSPIIPMKAACRTSPTWRSSRRCSSAARSSRSRARSPTRRTSAARSPGSTSANATEMYHEGLLLPPIKIWDAGKPLADIERIILANSRQPVLMRGDIHAQIAVTQMGATRVKELCERFGAATRDRRVRRHPQGRSRRTARARSPSCRRASRPPKACSTATASWSTSRSSLPSPSPSGTGSRTSISPPAIRRPEARSTCGPRWSRPACSMR